MFSENKNLKDTKQGPTPTSPVGDNAIDFKVDNSVSHTKAEKLITALYMVTNLMDYNDSLRTKIRSTGNEILVDVHYLEDSLKDKSNLSKAIKNNIKLIMSFLNIAETVNNISEMNSQILKNEFIKLANSIEEMVSKDISINDLFSDIEIDRVEFLNPSIERTNFSKKDEYNKINKESLKGQIFKRHPMIPVKNTNTKSISVGIQKSSDLLRTLSKKVSSVSGSNNFDDLRKTRRDQITKVIKTIKQGTIKDIKDKSNGVLYNIGDKTLQRELIDMVRTGVLKKTGEKRWSFYSLAT